MRNAANFWALSLTLYAFGCSGTYLMLVTFYQLLFKKFFSSQRIVELGICFYKNFCTIFWRYLVVIFCLFPNSWKWTSRTLMTSLYFDLRGLKLSFFLVFLIIFLIFFMLTSFVMFFWEINLVVFRYLWSWSALCNWSYNFDNSSS